MNEPWISNTAMVGAILGSTMGILGGVVGTLASFCIPKGKAKKLVLGVDIFCFALSCLLLVVGIIAYLSGQSYGIWYGFGLCGLIGTSLYGMFFFVFRSEYRKVELRKAMSEDITLAGTQMTNKIKHTIFITIACVLLTTPTLSAETPEPYKLDNGLTVILRPVPTVNKVGFVVLFNLGSAHDPIGKSGMAHLIEHLYVTAAAGDTPARDVMQFMERYPAGWNAQTGLDFTVIAGVVEAAQFEEELKDVAARINDLRITEADLVREVPRVSQELRNMYGGIPWLAGLNHTRAQLYPIPQGGQYGGAPAHVQAITLHELQQFWKDYYKPNNAILIIAGKFDVAEAQKSIHENFSQIHRGKPLPIKPPTPKAKTGKIYRVTVKSMVKDATGVAAIGYAPPSLDSKEYAPFLVVVSRLWSSLPPTFQMGKVQPLYYAPSMDSTTFALQAELSDAQDSETALRQLDQHLHTALTSELTPQDKQQAVSSITRFLGTVDTPFFWSGQDLYSFAFTVGRRYQLQIDSKALSDAVQRVTDADIQLLTTSIFAPEKRAAVIIELEK